ncbi:MAG: YhbY family RNA-binding protein [Candidatus Bathyarchaeota archaeon]|nr:YhbY family RNA-binding protein [Candidatus Bathyarchaeota archaeon]
MTLTNTQRQKLKAHAHSLKPHIQIGKNGVTEGQVNTIAKSLDMHELIKVKFNDYKSQKQQLSDEIAEKTESHIIDIIGNTLILYKRNPDASKRQIRV